MHIQTLYRPSLSLLNTTLKCDYVFNVFLTQFKWCSLSLFSGQFLDSYLCICPRLDQPPISVFSARPKLHCSSHNTNLSNLYLFPIKFSNIFKILLITPFDHYLTIFPLHNSLILLRFPNLSAFFAHLPLPFSTLSF